MRGNLFGSFARRHGRTHGQPHTAAHTPCLLDPLEPRRLMAATYDPNDDFLAAPPAGLNPRQEIVTALNASALKTQLQGDLNASQPGQFDQHLLEYMRTRTTPQYYFTHAEVNSDLAYIRGTDPITGQPNFSAAAQGSPVKELDGAATAAASASDLDAPGGNNNGRTWQTIAYTYRDQARINASDPDLPVLAEKLASRMTDWSRTAYADGALGTGDAGNAFQAARRMTPWVDAYFLMLNTTHWAPDANTLFVYNVLRNEDYLFRATDMATRTNRAVVHAAGQILLSRMFPEFSAAAAWYGGGTGNNGLTARDQMEQAVNGQFYSDGVHVEHSASYHELTLSYATGVYQLALKNQSTNPGDLTGLWNDLRPLVTAGAKAYSMTLTPSGENHLTGDSSPDRGTNTMYRAQFVLGDAALGPQLLWPVYNPAVDNVLMGGVTWTSGHKSNTATPANRGNTSHMKEGGYYVMRSNTGGLDQNQRQAIFNVGPSDYDASPNTGHGHADLLSFDLVGWQRQLITNPGSYIYEETGTPGDKRNWAVSTAAHNTVVVERGGSATTFTDADSHPQFDADSVMVRDEQRAVVEQWATTGSEARLSAFHSMYATQGGPLVGRSVWYGYGDTTIIVDRVSLGSTRYAASFTLPNHATLPAPAMTSTPGQIKGTNILIQPVLTAAGTIPSGITAGIVPGGTSSQPYSFYHDGTTPDAPATRYQVINAGGALYVATVISLVPDGQNPTVTAQFVTDPTSPTDPVQIRVTRAGQVVTGAPITLTPPQFTTYARRTDVQSFSDLAVNQGNGTVHQVYRDADGSLKYATRTTSGVWSAIETIDADPDTGQYPSLEVDSTGVPAVAYYDATERALKYARRAGTNNWSVTTVQSGPSVGLYPSLRFDASNVAHISYYDGVADTLKFAFGSGSSWTVQTPDPTSVGVGHYTSLVLRPTGGWGVAYADTANGRLKYATRSAGGTWSVSVANASISGGVRDVSLGVNPSGAPYIAYNDVAANALKVARQQAGSWSNELVSTNATAVQGLYANLFITTANNVDTIKVLFYRSDTLETVVATKTFATGGAWSLQTVRKGGQFLRADRAPGTGRLIYSALGETTTENEVRLIL